MTMVPGSTPAFTLTLNGKDLSPLIRPRLISLTLTEKRDDADELTIELDDTDGLLDLPATGVTLALALGWTPPTGSSSSSSDPAQGLVSKGTFNVDKVNHQGTPDKVTITASAADFNGDLHIRKTRTFVAMTLDQTMRAIAAEHNLTPKIDATVGAIRKPIVSQSRKSDLGLIKHLAHSHDAVATIKAGNLIVSPKSKGATASGTALPTVSLTRADGDQHEYEIAARDEYTGVSASWHDVDEGKHKRARAGETGKVKHLRRTYATEADANDAAAAELKRIQRGAQSFTYTLALGRPDIYPEQKVQVSGFKAQINAVTWLVSEATHTLSEGLTTQLKLENSG